MCFGSFECGRGQHLPSNHKVEQHIGLSHKIQHNCRRRQFALEDNVILEFELSVSPPQYGDALDTVAKDCDGILGANHSMCSQFDLIVGDYYSNPDRSLRVDFTPTWLRTTMSTVKCVSQNHARDPTQHHNLYHGLRRRDRQIDFTTLAQADAAGATVCVPDGTYLMDVVMGKFPNANYYKCLSHDDCIEQLRNETCVLYADDELLLRYRASQDDGHLEVTREQFNTQYIVWPMRRDLPEIVSTYVKRWMYAAVANATLDELYFKYFKKELCPVGTAGGKLENTLDEWSKPK